MFFNKCDTDSNPQFTHSPPAFPSAPNPSQVNHVFSCPPVDFSGPGEKGAAENPGTENSRSKWLEYRVVALTTHVMKTLCSLPTNHAL